MLQDELAKSVTMEQGKTLSDAKGDVFRGLGGLGQALFVPLSFTLSLPALSNLVCRGLGALRQAPRAPLGLCPACSSNSSPWQPHASSFSRCDVDCCYVLS